MDFYAFDKLLAKDVQSIFEKIFLSLDYESFKKCLEVSHSWEELLNSESFIKARKYLYQDEISNDQEKLAFAARQGDIDQVTRILVNKMLDVNAGHPLLKAVIGGHKVVVRLLLERGADPNKPEIGEKTPLHWSAYYGHRAVTKLLINGGGDPNQGDRDGRTPLHDAISTSFIKGGKRHQIKRMLTISYSRVEQRLISRPAMGRLHCIGQLITDAMKWPLPSWKEGPGQILKMIMGGPRFTGQTGIVTTSHWSWSRWRQ